MPPAVAHPSTRPSRPTLIATAILSALFLFGMTAVSTPGPVLGATYPKVALCPANLRTSPSTTARVRTSIHTGAKVGAVTRVKGSAWRATCAGKVVSGTSWFRIATVNGKSVKALYGVTYLYAATGLFKAVVAPTVTRYAACGTYLRTSASTSAAKKALLKTDTKVTCQRHGRRERLEDDLCRQRRRRVIVVPDHQHQRPEREGAVRRVLPVRGVGPVQDRRDDNVRPAHSERPTPTPAPTSPGMNRTEGIDVSHWQNTIDWNAVWAAGKKFTYIKASEDIDYVDPLYTTNRTRAKAAGLLVGAYHFAQPSTEAGDAVAEANHYVDTATPASGDLLPVLDLERSGGLTQTNLTAWVRAYLQRIYERTGVRAVIYCSPSFWKNYLGDTTWFAANGYKILWVAHWTTASQPTVPAAAWGGNNWTFWQYTSDGSVPGISGRVDLNRYNGTNFTNVRDPLARLRPPAPAAPSAAARRRPRSAPRWRRRARA